MNKRRFILPGSPWFEETPLIIEFPENWEVKRCRMACENVRALTGDEIRASIESAICTEPLGKMAKGKEEVVILIDDMTRPTKTYQYLPPILNALRKGGIPTDNIRFIMASGSHGPYDRLDFLKKLREEVVAEYQIYNHNPYEYLEYLGETKRGTPIYVNTEVMSCDLKIGIGTVLFHRLMGFSGGGKIILPGVSGIETIIHNHGEIGGFAPDREPHPSTGYLRYEGNIMRLDAEEAARMAGLDFKVDTVLNLRGDPVSIYAGDFVKTHRKAAKAALRWHKAETPREMDVVVANAHMRANEAVLALWPAYFSVRNEGTIVLIPNAPEGQVNHWVFGRHGKFIGARLSHLGRRRLRRGRRLIIYSPYKERSLDLRLGQPQQTMWLRDWEEVLEVLRTEHGPHPRVAILPDATSGIPEAMIEGEGAWLGP